VRRYLRGFSTDDESLALDEIRRVGICGSFLDTDHTFAHFREEVFLPERLVRVQRMSAGDRADLVSRAEDRVDEILAAAAEPVLDEKTERELLAIEKRYAAD
jgi:trimethylamine--corrinoid protein Co-methyltransferase